jgi:hypothetical protein
MPPSNALSLPAPSPPKPDAVTPAASPGLTAPQPYTPPRCDVPAFPPIRVGGRGGRRLLRQAVQRGRRTLAAGLALTAAVLAASAAHGAPSRKTPDPPRGPAKAVVHRQATHDLVRAPVRITDAAVVALLRPGDRVDVLARARIVATGVTVVAVPGQPSAPPADDAVPDAGGASGALVVLAVPRYTAAALSGAAASSPLAVTLC